MLNNKDFFQAVYQIVRLIPEGRVTTYGAIAQALGAKSSSRMVGWAMNASHRIPNFPAHRVVNRNGLLTGKMHFSQPDEMEKKLVAEGITVVQNQIQDFQLHFWHPSTELRVD
ncbi:MAG: MGMT family protein [Bacteroidetes bacterium]|nr:MGMT family protein [Bacteroidota bacterium]